MFNYLAKIYNGTGGNFVDILINVALFLESSYLSFLKAHNIAGFELPQRFRFMRKIRQCILAPFPFNRKSLFCYSLKLKRFNL